MISHALISDSVMVRFHALHDSRVTTLHNSAGPRGGCLALSSALTVRFAGVDEKPTRSVRHTAQSSAPPPPPCASHPQLAAHDALMRPFQALTDSCDEQPFNSLSEHPPPAHSHATRTLHSAPHAHTPPRTRPCPWRVLPDRAEQDWRSEPCLTMDLNICHETPSAHRTAHT
jgi:hypothetical protein